MLALRKACVLHQVAPFGWAQARKARVARLLQELSSVHTARIRSYLLLTTVVAVGKTKEETSEMRHMSPSVPPTCTEEDREKKHPKQERREALSKEAKSEGGKQSAVVHDARDKSTEQGCRSSLQGERWEQTGSDYLIGEQVCQAPSDNPPHISSEEVTRTQTLLHRRKEHVEQTHIPQEVEEVEVRQGISHEAPRLHQELIPLGI